MEGPNALRAGEAHFEVHLLLEITERAPQVPHDSQLS